MLRNVVQLVLNAIVNVFLNAILNIFENIVVCFLSSEGSVCRNPRLGSFRSEALPAVNGGFLRFARGRRGTRNSGQTR